MNLKLIIIISTLLVVVFSNLTTSEITKRKIAKPQTDISMPSEQYDGMKNFLGIEVKKYIGQTLYLLKDTFTTYFCQKPPCDMLNHVRDQDYKILENRYFEVLDAYENKDKFSSSDEYYLKLKEKKTGELWYFVYSSKYDFQFPFVVVKYFDTQKKNLPGQKFIVRSNPLADDGVINDINTGKPVTVHVGSQWEVVDVSIIEELYFKIVMILRNNKGEEMPFPTTLEDESKYIFNANQAEKYEKRFGKERWKTIINKKVHFGMTDEMCRLSWGEPKEINRTITNKIAHEQWVYEGTYLYFDDGVLTSVQD